jgi:hypothetical protein
MTYSREREALDTLIGFMEGTAMGLRMVGDEVDVERTAAALEERAKWARAITDLDAREAYRKKQEEF